MGCWDIFCFLCGNTCHSSPQNIKSNVIEIINDYKTIKNKWFKNYYADTYKKYNENPDKFIEKIKKLNKTTKWLNNCTFLSANGDIVHNCKEIDCNITFKDKKGNNYNQSTILEDIKNSYGLFVHTDCWKFIEKQYKMKLSYKHLPVNKTNKITHKFFNIDYGKIENYWHQEFDFIKMISDGNDELCQSPLKNKTVSNNIKKVFRKLKIRNDDSRQSPPVSATFYKEGIYRIGNNGNIWFIKNGKWYELKNTITTEVAINSIKHISYYEDINIKPIFVIKLINKKSALVIKLI